MANTTYNNFVLEKTLNDILTTKLNARTLMTIDNSLAENEGMIKKINRYTYSGTVEQVSEGSDNSTVSTITFTPEQYDVNVYSQKFNVTDEEAMRDSMVVDFGVNGMATTMVKDMNSKFYSEIQKATIEEDYTVGSFSYDDIVDAIGKLNREDETTLYILGSLDMRDAIRKADDFVAAKQGEIIFDGLIGYIAGIPFIASKLIDAGELYVADKTAVKLFMKKDVNFATERDEGTRTTSYYARLVGLCALVDATKVCRLAAPAGTATTITTKTSGAKTVAGACTKGGSVTVSVYASNGGALIESKTFDASTSANTYTVDMTANLATGNYIVVSARKSGQVSSIATATV